MKNGLTTIVIGVDDNPITVFGKTFFAGDFRRDQQHITERVLMSVFRLIKRRDVFARDRQEYASVIADSVSLKATQISSS